MLSVVPPAEYGMTRRIGFSGKDWAHRAGGAASTAASATSVDASLSPW